MNFLFVHQCFPGQYRHILRALSNQGHTIVGLGIHQLTEQIPSDIQYYRYPISRGNTPGIHDWLVDVDSKLIRGEACSRAAHQLKTEGFTPDIICAHPGWGEALFLKDVWPTVPLLCYQEYFYNPHGFDYDFDPSIQGDHDWESGALLRFKNASPLLMLEAATWNVTPTHFQKITFPTLYHSQFSVIHDGIDTRLASPSDNPPALSITDTLTVTKDIPIVTFVNRTIEPYRGCHTMIRSLPALQEACPDVHVVFVGATTGVSYGKAAPNNSWKDIFLDEISNQFDPTKVHFVGSLQYSDYINLLQLSSCHVYLTYPFVLSWSLLEAMSIGVPIIGSDTSPVREVISDNVNGLLVDFFDTHSLVSSIHRVLTDNELSLGLATNARQLIKSRYSLEVCIPQQLSLINLVASRSFD